MFAMYRYIHVLVTVCPLLGGHEGHLVHDTSIYELHTSCTYVYVFTGLRSSVPGQKRARTSVLSGVCQLLVM